jgi:hypothetical protein
MAPSDEVVTAKAKEMPESRCRKHTRWLGGTSEQKGAKAKEVEPIGHGERTRDHKLDLLELASTSSTMVVPWFVTHRLATMGSSCAGRKHTDVEPMVAMP